MTLIGLEWTRPKWWPGLTPFAARYVLSSCTHAVGTSRLDLCPLPTTLWRSIPMGFVVKLPRSNGYDPVFVIVGRLSTMAHFIPCNKTIFPVEKLARQSFVP